MPTTLNPNSNGASVASASIIDTVPTSFCKEGVNKGVHRLLLHENLKKLPVAKVTASPDDEVTAPKPHKYNLNDDDDMQMQELDIQQQVAEGQSRNPDKGLAYFINITDPVPLQHPRGEYPYENERGIVMVRLLKKLFDIIPSKLSNDVFNIYTLFVYLVLRKLYFFIDLCVLFYTLQFFLVSKSRPI